MTKYDAVLFDNDGILVEPPSHTTKVDALTDAFREVGVNDVETEHIDEFVADTTLETVHGICDVYDIDVDAFWKAREHYDEQSQFEKFKAGERTVYNDITALHDLSQACGVVSNNHHSTIEFILEYFELESIFDTYHGREKTLESLELKKPNTHYIDRALAELESESALFIGDRELDIVAAHRAGLDSVFVRRPHTVDTEFSITPTYVVENLHEMAEIAAGGSA